MEAKLVDRRILGPGKRQEYLGPSRFDPADRNRTFRIPPLPPAWIQADPLNPSAV